MSDTIPYEELIPLSVRQEVELGAQRMRFREERNKKLASTDFLMVSDFPFPSEDIRTAWRTYRQALRDLPVTSPPAVNEENTQLIITWPKPPIWPANVV
jgi:hypothetical protein